MYIWIYTLKLVVKRPHTRQDGLVLFVAWSRGVVRKGGIASLNVHLCVIILHLAPWPSRAGGSLADHPGAVQCHGHDG